ncbi:MAG: rod shape-determining protein MreC [Alistipes sp.]|nr:rod shape-determining protein MreC [Alistipes sp.]
MQKLIFFIRKSAVAVIFVVLEIIAIRCYAYSTPYTQSRLIAWSNSVFGFMHSAVTNMSNYFSLSEENVSLTEHIAMLKNRINELETAKSDAKVDVGEVMLPYKYLPARVVTTSTNRSRNFMTISKGSADGVVEDMAVMTPEGYAVGVVVGCTENFAVAKTLLNVDFRLGGMLAGEGSHGSVVWPGNDNQVVDFVELSKYAEVQEGDTVQVAGFSQYFPKEAIIGCIERIELAENGTSYKCKVRLSADIGRLTNVILVRNVAMDELRDVEEIINNK